MRFLIVTQYYAPEVGAPQVRLAALCARLRAAGHEVEVLTTFPSYPTGVVPAEYRGSVVRREVIDVVRVTRVWSLPGMGRGLRRLIGYLSFSIATAFGLPWCRRPDWVFVESPPPFAAVPAWLAAKVWRARVVLNIADLWPDAAVDVGAIPEGGLVHRVTAWFERWLYRRVDVVNAVTDGVAASIAQRAGEAPLMLPNGVDTEVFSPGPPTRLNEPYESAFAADRMTVVYTGNIGLAQGLENVLRAMAVLQDRDESVALVLIGDGSDRNRLQTLASELALRNVEFLPPVPPTSIPDILRRSDVALVSLADLPTNAGARPSKMFPAMGVGLPILFVGRSEASSIVASTSSGVAVDNDDIVGIADAMVRLRREPDLRRDLGRNARALALERFDWNAIVARWVADLTDRAR